HTRCLSDWSSDVCSSDLDPVTAYSASAPLPKHIDELMLAGFLRGAPVELVRGVTVDLEVPANAEMVLEGFIEKDELGSEGPFGRWEERGGGQGWGCGVRG